MQPENPSIKPDITFNLSVKQIEEIQKLINSKAKTGIILGSVGWSEKTLDLSYLPIDLARQITNLVKEYFDKNENGS